MFAGIAQYFRENSVFALQSGLPKRATRSGAVVALGGNGGGGATSFWSSFSSSVSKSGETVNHDTAQSLTAVWAAVRVLSDAISSLSWEVYDTAPDGNRTKRPNHWVARVLNRPDPLYNGNTFFETMQAWATLRGNAFAVIIRDGSGRPIRLRHVPNDCVWTEYNEVDGMLYYHVRSSTSAKYIVVDAADMLHIRALVWDAEDGMGKSPIQAHRDTIGTGLAGNGYMASLLKNGAHVKGILSTDQPLNPEQAKQMKQSWQAANAGVGAAGGTAVLQAGMKFQQLNLSPADAQWLQSSEFTVEEISRIFGVPLHKLASLKRSTNNNIEHQGREFVTDTLRPWAKRWETEIKAKLFGEHSRAHFKFDLNSRMRGDTESRAKMYQILLSQGVLNRNEVRRMEGFNAIPGSEGNVHLYPLNMATMDGLDKQVEQLAAPKTLHHEEE